jgi:glycosyltransferase involved in cell wall biosynthesis
VASEITQERPIVVHDCSGHPFQAQLSRWLAHQGLRTVHLHSPTVLTPKGSLTSVPGDPPCLEFRPVVMHRSFEKYALVRRVIHELEYGVRLSWAVGRLRPSVVVSSNTPLIAAALFHVVMLLCRIPVVFWQQDVYGIGITEHLASRFGRPGHAVGRALTRVEAWIARSSAAVVTISDDFASILRSWGVAPERVHVIENWAPLNELPVRPRDNGVAREHGIEDGFVFLYSGTLGIKHDPACLLALAEHFSDRPDVKVVVVSEGLGATWLAEHGSHVPGLVQLPYQPYDKLPDLLASADVLLAILERHAGVFSVPSKVLSYHCAGRPLLAAVPGVNLAARIIAREESGICVEPGAIAELIAAAKLLEASPDMRTAMGANARAYAEQAFDIERIGRSFLDIITRASDSDVLDGSS